MGVASSTARAKIIPSKTPKIYNKVSPGTANTEFSQVLSTGTRQFLVRNRSNTDLQLAYTATESGTNFLTIKKNAVYEVKDIQITATNNTLYMQTSGTSETIEIVEWV